LDAIFLNRKERKDREEGQKVDLEDIGRHVVDSAVKIHRALGPGLLESAYQQCLAYELEKAGLKVECEVVIPIQYEEIKIDNGYRVDMLINDLVIIENKTVDRLLNIHMAQILTYLKMRDLRLGYLINWNVKLIKDGIQRLVNNL
jgi:GxxExxY protein